MTDKLIPCSDFVLLPYPHELGQDMDAWRMRKLQAHENYAKMCHRLNEPWMFIPCDADGEPLSNPETLYADGYYDNEDPHGDGWDKPGYKKDTEEYKAACDRVLFEGFTFEYPNTIVKDNKIFWFGELKGTIEDLTHLDLTLTTAAKKMIYGRDN